MAYRYIMYSTMYHVQYMVIFSSLIKLNILKINYQHLVKVVQLNVDESVTLGRKQRQRKQKII